MAYYLSDYSGIFRWGPCPIRQPRFTSSFGNYLLYKKKKTELVAAFKLTKCVFFKHRYDL